MVHAEFVVAAAYSQLFSKFIPLPTLRLIPYPSPPVSEVSTPT